MGDIITFVDFLERRSSHINGLGNRLWRAWTVGPPECCLQAFSFHEVDPVADADLQAEAMTLQKREVVLRSSSPGGVAATDADQATKARNELAQLLERLAEIRRQQHRWVEAAGAIMRLARLPASSDGKAHSYIDAAICLEKEQRYAEAARVCALAIKVRPDRKELQYFARNNLAFAQVQLERYDEAELHCKAAIEIDQARHNAFKNLGLALTGLARYQEAVGTFLRADSLYPRDSRASAHLIQLVTKRPELLDEVQRLREEIEQLVEKRRAWSLTRLELTEGHES